MHGLDKHHALYMYATSLSNTYTVVTCIHVPYVILCQYTIIPYTIVPTIHLLVYMYNYPAHMLKG